MDDAVPGGRYRRDRRLGRGAMGDVWLAHDTLLHRQVALKTVLSFAAAGSRDLDLMMREARLAAQLNSPNAVGIYDVIVENGAPCVVMEYVAGQSLADRIAEAGRLPVDEVARIGIAIAEALREAHALGMIHRDVKPANILITERGVPKLADFGIARLILDAEQTVTSLAVGTPAYLAPEIARGETSDRRCDIWSLGVTLYAALDGESPFAQPGDSPISVVARLAQIPQAPPPTYGGALSPAVMQMMSVDPGQRPTADRVAAMLRSGVPAHAPAGEKTVLDAQLRWQGPVVAPAAAAGQQPAAELGPLPAAELGPLAPTGSDTTMRLRRVEASRPPRRPRNRIILALAAAAVILAAAAVGLARIKGPSSGRPHATRDSGSSSSVSRSSAVPASTTRYAAPGGLSVLGPQGWTPDGSAGIPNVRDYVAPGAANHDVGTYFRIGIGNPDPKPSMAAETQATISYLTSPDNPYHDVQIVQALPGDFLGVASSDIEFVGTSRQGVARHVLERLWIAGGVTREIVLNATSDTFDRYRPVFDQLVSSAKVS
ncbi:MAG: hypothetical protein DLM57_06565 [Pseudonocardiales bacterium]|nr:MAG: hypothetical protein DLM57_06565 [Pseudonocardiales bacterium]